MTTKNVDEFRLVVWGANGKMGQRVCRLAQSDPRFQLVGEVVQDTTGNDKTDNKLAVELECDVIVDFSSDEGTIKAAQCASALRSALLVGTTGLSQQTTDIIEFAAKTAAVIIAPNTSPGMSVCMHLIMEAARRIGLHYDVDLIEKHHVHKRDVPSGTALKIADALRENTNIDLARERIHSIRSGEIIGEHSIEFSGFGEQIKISHFVSDRDVFARGALDAAAWLVYQQPGLYTMDHALKATNG